MDFHHPYLRGLPPRSEDPALFIRPPPRATAQPAPLPYSLPPSSTPYGPVTYAPAAYNYHQSQSQSQQHHQEQQHQQQHYQPPAAASFPSTIARISVPPSASQPSTPLEASSYRFPPVNHGSGMNQNRSQNRSRSRSSYSYSYSQNHNPNQPRVAAGTNIFGEGRDNFFFIFFNFLFFSFYLRLLFVLCLPRATPYWSPTVESDIWHEPRQLSATPATLLSCPSHPILSVVSVLPWPASQSLFSFCHLLSAVTRQDRPPSESSGALVLIRNSAG